MTRTKQRRRGFSLIEAAIVLGVVGMVIGGIWVAANAVIRKQRINEAAAVILQIVQGARGLLPLAVYPDVNYANTPGITETLKATGIIPYPLIKADGGPNFAVTPSGFPFEVRATCFPNQYADTCPSLEVIFVGKGGGWGGGKLTSTLTSSDCAELVRKVIILAGTRSGLEYIGVGMDNPAIELAFHLYKDDFKFWSEASITCPDIVRAIHFYFLPR
ncbi:MAG: type II secretion system protein [Candidatus Saccharimonadales bacterium]